MHDNVFADGSYRLSVVHVVLTEFSFSLESVFEAATCITKLVELDR